MVATGNLNLLFEEFIDANDDLIVHVAAGEERPARVGELGEDAAGAPHVDARRVELGAEQDVGRPVPERHHLQHGQSSVELRNFVDSSSGQWSWLHRHPAPLLTSAL